jgi:hypothetical protein
MTTTRASQPDRQACAIARHLEVYFPRCLISRGFGRGFGVFGFPTTFVCSRYHAGNNVRAVPKVACFCLAWFWDGLD